MGQKIKQHLQGNKETAELEAKYGYEKDEIIYKIDISSPLILKLKLTGNRRLSGNKWGYDKVYEGVILESNNSVYKIGELTSCEEDRVYDNIQSAAENIIRIMQNNINREVEYFGRDMISITKHIEFLKELEKNNVNV